ncbi:ABC-2 transporter permease [Actinomadura rudentiformis]|uniref:ABC transporter permease n=1 Tax=Actinomadura rudentiformis TaxID=359158 RepID=A0A6H9YMS8_9ACTN|nr:ABC transporter permease [Actinomadura rudentiformis]KAB2348841.1 ABC transporter permease [Actinomadura rudentiformis]
MTAITAPAALLEPARPSLVRLTAVELRKMIDTRSSRWLLIIISLVAVAMMPVVLFAVPKQDQTLLEFFTASQVGVSILLPILGILAVTTEWSQRTALTTFTLVPERPRILAAKLIAGSVLGALFACVGLAVALIARTVGELMGRSDGSWSLSPGRFGVTVLLAVVMLFMGIAFGTLFMNSPLAIVLFLVLPIVWSTLGGMISKLKGPAGWLDTNLTLTALTEPGITGEEWARAGTSLAVWMLLPLVIGTIRLIKREVK